MTSLDLALLYLVAAVLGVVACRSLKLPPMLGYLAVGVTIGPNALAFAHDSASIQYLAEFGVVFLMFVIGLEFNLPKLRALKTAVFGLGLAQVVLTIAGAMLGNALLVAGFAALGWAWDLGWRGALCARWWRRACLVAKGHRDRRLAAVAAAVHRCGSQRSTAVHRLADGF